MEHCLSCAPGTAGFPALPLLPLGMGRSAHWEDKTQWFMNRDKGQRLQVVVSVFSENPSIWLGNLETSLLYLDFQNKYKMGETGIRILPSRPHPVSHVLFLYLCSWEIRNYSRMP